ncbi:hypothetical protein UT300007_19570 [Clostridium sp. CTA-7]
MLTSLILLLAIAASTNKILNFLLNSIKIYIYVKEISTIYTFALNFLSLKAFNNTDTELKLIAPAAIIGFNNGPPNT